MNEIISKYMSELGKKGGKASAKSRFIGMDKEERGKLMKRVRRGDKFINK